jgi:hypothetical protein
MNIQHRGPGAADDPTGPTGPDRYADARPVPGIEFEELVGSRAAPRQRAPRWTMVVLAVGAAAATMGLGGRLLGGPESRRDADGIAVASADPGSSAIPVHATPGRSTVGPSEGADLPLGFAVTQAAIQGPSGNGRLIILGFVPRQEPVSVRLRDPDGSIAASLVVQSRPVDLRERAGGPLWAFEAMLEVPPTLRLGGPEGRLLEVWWVSASSVTTICAIPLAGPGAHHGAAMAMLPLALYARCR